MEEQEKLQHTMVSRAEVYEDIVEGIKPLSITSGAALSAPANEWLCEEGAEKTSLHPETSANARPLGPRQRSANSLVLIAGLRFSTTASLLSRWATDSNWKSAGSKRN
ncbi:hypothetical protein EYF80_000459 [Liparis tanakae]|uniref:Uncharacterized protein n=1 Tax=Liparis tanakae TaxID=230148 RepID=A0A4Z2JGS8_9TELE|nr:hypothetical protein EYF80_000459 [Liparis tanakae]